MKIMTWKETLPEIEQTITADSAGGLIMAFILYVIVVFGMFGTVLMMTEERKYEFGVLISIWYESSPVIWYYLIRDNNTINV